MAEILLLEPNYNNKYPPLGLMKICYFHKEEKGDYVRFAKGRLPDNFKKKKWDRVYITTLFTFEWEETKNTIRYALEVARDPSNVYIGGIAASLMQEKFKKEFEVIPEKNILTGQLNVKGVLGYEDDDKIDRITPDYSMLNDIRDQYIYPTENAYFMYTTRGCGMNCGFCAVQQLEPKYEPYISIKDQIENIAKKYGEKKDLLLMDNNVLKSPRFFDIVDEIKALGFGKGATYKSPSSGKFIKRYVDFNQGLDGFLLTEEKAEKLSELAIKPARIAFDHIEDTEVYETAIKRCAKYGITELSNYILYNSDEFTGKGNQYNADTPLDLYYRLKTTLDLKEKINAELPKEKKIAIFSFPMRYIPLKNDKRGYVGKKWNTKYLRAVQRMLIPTQGKGVSSKSFFEADFGTSPKEYMQILAMPEDIIATRGRFEDKKDETKEENKRRKEKWEENRKIFEEWKRLFENLKGEEDEFIKIISSNQFSTEIFLGIHNETMRKLYLHYMSTSQFLLLLNVLNSDKNIHFLVNYCTNEFPLFIKKIAKYIYNSNSMPFSRLNGFIKIFGQSGLKYILELWVSDGYIKESLFNSIERSQNAIKIKHINTVLLQIFKSFYDLKCLSKNDIVLSEQLILGFKNDELVKILKKNSKKYKKALNESIKGEAGYLQLSKQIDILTVEIFKQLSLY